MPDFRPIPDRIDVGDLGSMLERGTIGWRSTELKKWIYGWLLCCPLSELIDLTYLAIHRIACNHNRLERRDVLSCLTSDYVSLTETTFKWEKKVMIANVKD